MVRFIRDERALCLILFCLAACVTAVNVKVRLDNAITHKEAIAAYHARLASLKSAR